MAKTCFVLMGFGEKTDFRSDRKLNLDKTYKIIQSAVAACGVTCIRADDIIHSSAIDKPMYEQLLEADIAIADLSTSNENAIYELGVRHALRPNTTIVIAESRFSFPFRSEPPADPHLRPPGHGDRLRGSRAPEEEPHGRNPDPVGY